MTNLMIAHRPRREQDEWYCYRCGKRWAVGEAEPLCAALGQGKPMVTNERGEPLNRRHPPEGDTVSEGMVHVVFDGPPGHESGRFVECETPDGRSINIGQWHERNDGLWELGIPTAIQSRVSPQAGMREALERAQSQVGTLAREILREVGAGTCDNWVNALNGIAREINAALSTTPIPMSEDADAEDEDEMVRDVQAWLRDNPPDSRERRALKRLFDACKYHDPDDWSGEPAMIEAAQVLGEPPFGARP